MGAITSALRTPIKRLFNRFGLDLISYSGPRGQPPELLARLAAEMVTRLPNFKFIQVGANDGSRLDPVFDVFTQAQPAGVLVEPLPDMFAALQANYAGCPRMVFENVAIGEEPGELTLYRIPMDAQVPDHLHGGASFSRELLLANKRYVPNIEELLVEVRVPMITMTELILRNQCGDAQLLIIDTEGFDGKILRAALAAGLHPEVAYFEHAHLSPTELNLCHAALESRGYRSCQVGINTVAIRE